MSIDQTGWSADKKALHNVFLVNECSESNAYSVSHAGTENSGYSFGFNQFDLSANSDGRTIFENIMDNAKDSSGSQIISSSDKTAIKQVWKTKGNQNAFTSAQKTLLNNALSSTYGKNEINTTYAEELDSCLERVNTVINSVTDSADKTFLETQVVKLFLADYHNQYNLSVNGKMNKYLKGESVSKSGGGSIQKSGVMDWDDLMLNYSSTQYNTDNPNDGKRRAKNVIEKSDLSATDKQNYTVKVDDAFDGTTTTSIPVSGFSFPLNIGKGITPDSAVCTDFHTHVEKTFPGGYYPLGANTIWHGGIHLRSSKGATVHAFADGEVIAARLAQTKENAYGSYGSHNFILIRHTLSGDVLNRQFSAEKQFTENDQKTLYSLYMHLDFKPLDINTEDFKKIPWIQNPIQYKVKKVISFRSSPEIDDTTLLGKLAIGDTLQQINPEVCTGSDYEWVHVKTTSGSQADISGFVAISGNVEGYIEEDEVSNNSILESLKSNNIVNTLNKKVKSGEPIWYAGEYGGSLRPILHWELFSKENLFPSMLAIEDSDNDFNIDSEQIFKLVDQDDGWFDDMENLTSEEIIRFYETNTKAESLRKTACKFMSEWAVDPDVGIPKLKNTYITFGLKDRLIPYLWWSDAIQQNIPLPDTSIVWHYNPIQVVQILSMLSDAPVAAPETTPEAAPAVASDPETSSTNYGEFVLKKNDNDDDKKWGGATQTDDGSWVEELQKDLVKLGYWISGPTSSTSKGMLADGDFGTNVEKAVKSFQFENFVLNSSNNIDTSKTNKITGILNLDTANKIKEKVNAIGTKTWDRVGHSAKKKWKLNNVVQSEKDYGTFYHLPPSKGYYRIWPTYGSDTEHAHTKLAGVKSKTYQVIPTIDSSWTMSDCWGKKSQIEMLKKTGDTWATKKVDDKDVPAFMVADVSGFNGGPIDPHRTHKDGTGTDTNGVICSTKAFTEEWHRDCALELAKLLKTNGAKRILFNCHYVIKNCSIAQQVIAHHHHFHIDGPDTTTSPLPDRYTTCNSCGIFDTCTKKIKKVRKNSSSTPVNYNRTATKGSSDGLYATGGSRVKGTVKLSQVTED